MDAVVGVANSMAGHRELILTGFHLVWHKRGKCQSYVQGLLAVCRKADGYHLVGIRRPILALIPNTVAHEGGLADGTVEAQLPMIVAGFSAVVVVDEQSSQRLIILRVVSLYMQLQRVGQSVVLIEQRLAYFRNPLAGPGILVAVNGLSSPQGDIVQLKLVLFGSAIDERTQFPVTNGQRLLEILGRTVVP